jgi:AraC-like DNA-binding protein
MGEIETMKEVDPGILKKMGVNLEVFGLEIMEDRRIILVEKIKLAIIEMIYFTEETPKMNFSDFLSKKLNYDYTYLANIFSELEGKTIEQNIISHKIERVKELLTFNEMNLTEIAFNMHYSSVAHLSNQFKKTTGITTSDFKLSLNKVYKA